VATDAQPFAGPLSAVEMTALATELITLEAGHGKHRCCKKLSCDTLVTD